MKNSTFWIIISIVVVLIGFGVYFAIKLINDGKESNDNDSFFAKFRKKNNGDNSNGGNSGNNGNSSSDNNEDQNHETELSVIAKASKLKDAIYKLAFNRDSILREVLKSVNSQIEWNSILDYYKELTGNTFSKDFDDEWISASLRKEYRNILTDKEIEPKF